MNENDETVSARGVPLVSATAQPTVLRDSSADGVAMQPFDQPTIPRQRPVVRNVLRLTALCVASAAPWILGSAMSETPDARFSVVAWHAEASRVPFPLPLAQTEEAGRRALERVRAEPRLMTPVTPADLLAWASERRAD